jgi:cbb3-type cytochrome oxidase subunit 3
VNSGQLIATIVISWLILALIAWMTRPKKNRRAARRGSFTQAHSSRRHTRNRIETNTNTRTK